MRRSIGEKMILNEQSERYVEIFDRDRDYWNSVYGNKSVIQAPSPFAQELLSRLEAGKFLVDMGCGNGRDSLFFASHGLRILGVDASDVAIQTLKEREDAERLRFECTDFVTIALPDASVDYCYCRFTLHAINEKQADIMLNNVARILKPGGELFIEARSIYDPLCGKGKPVGENAYVYNGHYRRFLSPKQVRTELDRSGLLVVFCEVSDTFAPYQGEKPPVLRVIAKKRNEGR